MPITYPFDNTGESPENRIINELHPITEANYKHYYFIVPKFAPYFAKNIVIKLREPDGSLKILDENIDYYLVMPFTGASRSLGLPLYGGVVFNLNYRSGIVEVDYNTLGGEWVADSNYVLNFLATKAYNPRSIYWDQVTNIQNTFPPNLHNVDYDDITGQGEIIKAISDIEKAITQRPFHDVELLTLRTDLNLAMNKIDALQTRLATVENILLKNNLT